MKLIVGLFESLSEAEATRSELASAGFDQDNISLVGSEKGSDTGSGSGLAEPSAAYAGEGGGATGQLKQLGVPAHDAQLYAEGVRRDGVVVALRSPADKVERALEIMDDHGSIDIDDRLSTWRSEGFVHEDRDMTATSAQGSADRTTTTGENGKIEVAEEQISVGKRQVERGGVRVRTRVIETPVEEQVELRDETVRVERHAVDRPADAAAFKEGTIEVKETDEEAVVQKQARVVEEIEVGKDVDVHTETVKDTVRRTEVDVDKLGPDETKKPS